MGSASEDPAGEDLWELTIDDLLVSPDSSERESQTCAPTPYVVDLSVDIEPFGVLRPSLADFDHLHVYQVTDWQDDRLVFRLRLGPIDSELEADMILTVVRRDYPNACSLLACDDDFRMMAIVAASAKPREAKFEMSKPVVTTSEPAAPPPTPPPAEEPTDFAKALRDIATDILSLELAVPALRKPSAPDAAPVPPPTLTAAVVTRRATSAPAGESRAKPPSPRPAATAVPVLQLESVARSRHDRAERAAPAEPARAAAARATATTAAGARAAKPTTPVAAARASTAQEQTVTPPAAVARPAPSHAAAAAGTDAEAQPPATAAKATKAAPASGVTSAPVSAAAEAPRVAMRRTAHEAAPAARDESTVQAARSASEEGSPPAPRPAAAEKAPVATPPPAVPTARAAREPAPAKVATPAAAGGAAKQVAAAVDPASTPPATAPAKAPRVAPPTGIAPAERIVTPPTARAASPPPAKSPPVPRPSEPARAAAAVNGAKVATAARVAAPQRAPAETPRAPSAPARDSASAKQAAASETPTLEVLPGPPPPIDSTQTLRALVMPEASDVQAEMLLVVQLATSDAEFVPDSVPNLAIFNEYRLYTAVGYQEGRVMYALRLGFFTDQGPAEAVAGYLRSYFDAPAVTRVSREERERFGKRRVKARKDSGETGVYAAIELSSTPSAPATSLADLSARAKVSPPGMSGDTARTRGPTRG